MEAKRGRIVFTALFVLLLAATSVAATGCDLAKVSGTDPAALRTVSDLASFPSSYFRGLLSMDAQQDETFDFGSLAE